MSKFCGDNYRGVRTTENSVLKLDKMAFVVIRKMPDKTIANKWLKVKNNNKP